MSTILGFPLYYNYLCIIMSDKKEWWELLKDKKPPKYTPKDIKELLESFLKEVEDKLPDWEELKDKLDAKD